MENTSQNETENKPKKGRKLRKISGLNWPNFEKNVLWQLEFQKAN